MLSFAATRNFTGRRAKKKTVSPEIVESHPSHMSASASRSFPQASTRLRLRDLKSITVENRDLAARDHMANERTFLAWLRTSLSFITIGIGIAQLFRLDSAAESPLSLHSLKTQGKVLGASFIGLGILTLVFGVVRYFQVQYTLRFGMFPATRIGILLLVAIAGVLVSYASAVIIRSIQ